MEKLDGLLKVLPQEFRGSFRSLSVHYDKLQEIRLRVGGPVLVYIEGQEYSFGPEGLFCERAPERISRVIIQGETDEIVSRKKQPWILTREQMNACLEYMSSYSAYAFMEEVRQGFLTLPGGHRVGLCGKTVMEGNSIKTICNMSSINIRVAHEKKDCSKPWLPYLYEEEQPCSVLILSPPGCGKTTLLRDFICQLSNGNSFGKGVTVSVIDERSEIAACYQGIPQNEVGFRTDVLDCCKKAAGMELVIRSMAPKVLAIDELGGEEDVNALERVLNCGCKLLATVHGESIGRLKERPALKRLFRERWFERYLVLKGGRVGEVEGIYDKNFRCLTDSHRLYGNGGQSECLLEKAVSGA